MFQKLWRKTFCSVYGWAYLWLVSAAVLYLLGFFRPVIGIPCTLVLLAAAAKSILEAPEQTISFRLFDWKWAAILTCILLWVYLCAIGGYLPQNRDQIFRNRVFLDLIQFHWPLTHEKTILVYYLGFWLPCAAAGKLVGAEAGFAVLFVQTAIGITLVFTLLCDYLEKTRFRTLLVLIFWGGISVIFFEIAGHLPFERIPLLSQYAGTLRGSFLFQPWEWAYQVVENSPVLCWNYNQSLPCWLGCVLMLCLIKHRRYHSLPLIASILAIFCPFQVVILLPFSAIVFLAMAVSQTEGSWKTKFSAALRECFRIEILAAILFLAAVAVYYKSGSGATHFCLLDHLPRRIIEFVVVFFCGCGIYFVLLPRPFRKNPLLHLLIIETACVMLFRIGYVYDFTWRAAQPLAFFTMVFVLECLFRADVKRWAKTAVVLILCCSAYYQIKNFNQEIKTELHTPCPVRPIPEQPILISGDDLAYAGVSALSSAGGTTDSFYCRHLAPRHSVKNVGGRTGKMGDTIPVEQ